jgi:hypothetical protein
MSSPNTYRIIYGVIIGLLVVYFLATTAMFIKYRHHPSIQYRSFYLSLLSIFAAVFMFAIHISFSLEQYTFPCWIIFCTTVLGLYLTLGATASRAALLLAEFYTNKAMALRVVAFPQPHLASTSLTEKSNGELPSSKRLSRPSNVYTNTSANFGQTVRGEQVELDGTTIVNIPGDTDIYQSEYGASGASHGKPHPMLLNMSRIRRLFGTKENVRNSLRRNSIRLDSLSSSNGADEFGNASTANAGEHSTSVMSCNNLSVPRPTPDAAIITRKHIRSSVGGLAIAGDHALPVEAATPIANHDAAIVAFCKAQKEISNNFYFRHRAYLTEKRLLITIGIVELILAIIVVLICTFSERYGFTLDSEHIGVNDCVHGSEQILTYIIYAVFVFFILPILLFHLRKIEDAHGIRPELLVIIIMWMLVSILHIVLLAFHDHSQDTLSACNVWALGCIISHASTITVPVFRVYYERKQRRMLRTGSVPTFTKTDNPRAAFRELLNDPVKLEKFKAFTVRDLSMENVVFYEYCTTLLKIAESAPDDEKIQHVMWFSETFLLPDSELEVNLTFATRCQLEAMCTQQRIDPAVLEIAREEIENLMFFDTYQRYLQRHSRDSDSDTYSEKNTKAEHDSC